MLSEKHIVAATRFGLGVTPGMMDDMRDDPRGWVVAQVEGAVTAQEYDVPMLDERLSVIFPKAGAGDAKTISRRREAFINSAREARIGRALSTPLPMLKD
ncbi:hypothetical protein ACFQ4K_03695 [Tistrella bauzanensis]